MRGTYTIVTCLNVAPDGKPVRYHDILFDGSDARFLKPRYLLPATRNDLSIGECFMPMTMDTWTLQDVRNTDKYIDMCLKVW